MIIIKYNEIVELIMKTKVSNGLKYTGHAFWMGLLVILIASFSPMPIYIFLAKYNWITVTIAFVVYAAEVWLLYLIYQNYVGKNHIITAKLKASFGMRQLVIVIVGAVVMLALASCYTWLIDRGQLGQPENAQLIETMMGQHKFGISLAAIVFGPMCEELIFRGFFLNSLLKNHQDQRSYQISAVIISSLLFGFLHSGTDWQALIYYSSLGAVLAVVYLKSGRDIRASISTHILSNLVILLLG